MNPNYKRLRKEDQYTLQKQYMYVAISKQTGKFFEIGEEKTRCAWDTITGLRNSMNFHSVSMENFFIYKIYTCDKKPMCTLLDWRYDPQITSRHPLTEEEVHDFMLIEDLISHPASFDVYIEDDRVYYKYNERHMKYHEEFKDTEFEFKSEPKELIRELFHFLKVHYIEIKKGEM